MAKNLNELVQLMNQAREQSDKINLDAFNLRQVAIRLQFEAKAATDAASLIVVSINECNDPQSFASLALASKQAATRSVEATLQAIEAVEKANAADKKVVEAFKFVRAATEQLSIVLSEEITKYTS